MPTTQGKRYLLPGSWRSGSGYALSTVLGVERAHIERIQFCTAANATVRPVRRATVPIYPECNRPHATHRTTPHGRPPPAQGNKLCTTTVRHTAPIPPAPSPTRGSADTYRAAYSHAGANPHMLRARAVGPFRRPLPAQLLMMVVCDVRIHCRAMLQTDDRGPQRSWFL